MVLGSEKCFALYRTLDMYVIGHWQQTWKMDWQCLKNMISSVFFGPGEGVLAVSLASSWAEQTRVWLLRLEVGGLPAGWVTEWALPLHFRDVSYLCDTVTGQEAKKTMTGRSSFFEGRQDRRGSRGTVPRIPVSAAIQVFFCVYH